jgi:hypothetical protein
VPLLRDGNARPDVITHPLPALALSYGSEDVKAAFEPVIEAMGDLDRLMLRVVGGINTIYGRLRTIDCEVAMEFNHSVSGIDQVGTVHLDFVVVLSTTEGCSKDEDYKCDPELSVTHRMIGVTTSHEEDYQLQNEFGVANK